MKKNLAGLVAIAFALTGMALTERNGNKITYRFDGKNNSQLSDVNKWSIDSGPGCTGRGTVCRVVSTSITTLREFRNFIDILKPADPDDLRSQPEIDGALEKDELFNF